MGEEELPGQACRGRATLRRSRNTQGTFWKVRQGQDWAEGQVRCWEMHMWASGQVVDQPGNQLSEGSSWPNTAASRGMPGGSQWLGQSALGPQCILGAGRTGVRGSRGAHRRTGQAWGDMETEFWGQHGCPHAVASGGLGTLGDPCHTLQSPGVQDGPASRSQTLFLLQANIPRA